MAIGKSRLGSLAAAMWFLKEEFGKLDADPQLVEDGILECLEMFNIDIDNFKLKFKTYDGADDLAGGDLLSAQINNEAGEFLHFYQFPMNGLSPNAAKNLNFFRDGIGWPQSANKAAGTDAVGYTIQFVTPKESRSEEEILPANPAVWETVPKEDKDLDIYYEASDTLPIKLELNRKNFLDFIPIGSTVEHLDSTTIPSGTTVHDVNEATGEIILTSNVEVAKDTAWNQANFQATRNLGPPGLSQ